MGENNDNDNDRDDKNGDNNDRNRGNQNNADLAYQESEQVQEFANYVPSTTDPGPFVLVGTVSISVAILLLSFLYLRCKRKRSLKRKTLEATLAALELEDRGMLDPPGSVMSDNDDFGDFALRKRSKAGRLMGWSAIATHMNDPEDEILFPKAQPLDDPPDDLLEQDLFERGGFVESFKALVGQEPEKLQVVKPMNSAMVNDSYNLMGDDPNADPNQDETIGGLCRYICSLVSCDKESKKILKLAIPYTVSSLISSICDVAILGVIGRLLGTREMTSYLMVHYGIELATLLLSGVLESIATVSAQAVGSERYKLAGQYVQIAVFIYLLGLIPQGYFWWNYVGKGMAWLDFDEESCLIAQQYAKILFVASVFDVFPTSLSHFLEISDYEKFATLIGCIQDGASLAATIWLVLQDEIPYFGGQPTLFAIGALSLAISVVFFLFTLVYMRCQSEWWPYYAPGLFHSFGLANFAAVKNFFKTAIPLALGYVLAYGEWEALFILASRLGPAEVAAWGILGEIWSAMEAMTYAWGDAAEVRCAHLMGAGRAAAARLSSHKSLMMGVFGSLAATIFVLSCSKSIPRWITDDFTLQDMVDDLLPLIAVGNIALTLGTISFQLVGAQARYSLATAVQFVGSWFVTLPLAIVSTVVLRWDLKGMAASIILGYMVSGTMNFVVLSCTNWEKRTAKIVAKNKKMAMESGETGSNDGSEDGIMIDTAPES